MQKFKHSKLWIFYLFKAYPNIVKISIFIAITNILMLLSPIVFSEIIDSLTFLETNTLLRNISIITIIGLAVIVFNALISIYQNNSTILFQDELRLRLWHNLSFINIENFEELSIGEWQSKMLYDISVVSSSTQVFISTFIPAAILLLGGVFIIATKEAIILLLLLALVILNILVYILFKKSIFYLAEKYRKSVMKQNQFLLDIVELIPIIRIFLLKKKFLKKLEENLFNARCDNISLNNKSIYLSSFISASIKIIEILVLIISVYLCSKNILSVGEVVLYQVLLTQSLSALNQIFSISPQIEVAKDSYLSLSPFMDKIREDSSNKYIFSKAIIEEDIVELKNISFKYKDAESSIFDDIDFRVKRNITLCVYGKIASGKTSLTKLITNLYTPTKGEIKIKLLGETKLPLAYVGQSVAVFQSSLFENIRLFDENISRERVISIIKSLKLDKFFSRFNNDLDLEISQGKLSGGQIQCIGILRALVRNPEILILDEITNNLDVSAKINIYNFINSLKNQLTIIIISHDIDFYEFSDEVYLISNKKLKKISSKESLIEKLSE